MGKFSQSRVACNTMQSRMPHRVTHVQSRMPHRVTDVQSRMPHGVTDVQSRMPHRAMGMHFSDFARALFHCPPFVRVPLMRNGGG